MNVTELFLGELEREAVITRRALERVPEGRDEWAPHAKSMRLGRLATLVATMPSWITMMIERDELDLSPPGGSPPPRPALRTTAELLQALDQAVAGARAALGSTSEEHMLKPWRLLVSGKTVAEQPRHIMIRDSINHLAHHRGQLTVYLRLNDVAVPSIYGPTADDTRF
jgi:uncharacterized damage-inducible protein DinB